MSIGKTRGFSFMLDGAGRVVYDLDIIISPRPTALFSLSWRSEVTTAMSLEPNGELVPQGGGDSIPLLRSKMTVGRMETCDICLRLPNISKHHCELVFQDGFWWIRDLNSTNGIKVNGERVLKKVLRNDDTITLAKRVYKIEYIHPVGQHALAELLEQEEDILSQSLLERAGLEKPGRSSKSRPLKPIDPADYLLEDDDE
jgi:pSer/pThr/pTyr-binding forkhead associated (FHA) protein